MCCRNTVVYALRWLNTILRALDGNLRDDACFKLDKKTWRRKNQWYTDDDFSKSTQLKFCDIGRIFTFFVFYINRSGTDEFCDTFNKVLQYNYIIDYQKPVC